jgi:hypothetical protein
VFSVIDALAAPALLDFHAAPSGATVTVAARAAVPPGARMVLIGPAGEIANGVGEVQKEVPAAQPAAYRVEVRLASAPGQPPVPWLVSNPIAVAGFGGAPPIGLAPVLQGSGQFPWRIEKDPVSSAILRTPGQAAELEYHLADGPRASQFVAIASDLRTQTFSAIDLVLGADRPARVGVQVRVPDGRRWGRSYFVDPAGTPVHAALADLRGVGESAARVPPSESLTSVILVVDLTNAAPGRSGRLLVKSSALVK